MKIKNMLFRLAKHGYRVEEIRRSHVNWADPSKPDVEYVAYWIARIEGSKNYIEISSGNPGSDRIGSIRSMRDGWVDDLQSDYWAGSWCSNLAQAIRLDTMRDASVTAPVAQPEFLYGYLGLTA